MSHVLSQNEVDSLLEGISDGTVETATDAAPEDADAAPTYDFTTQAGPGHLRMPALSIINERSVGYMRTSFSAVARTGVDVTLSKMESIKFGEFCRRLPLPASLNIFKVNPLRGYALLEIDGQLVFSFVDVVFGGKGGAHVKLEGRGFTNIESKIIHKIVRIALADMERAWADFHAVEMTYERSEMDPQFASIVNPNDMVIAIQFRVDLPQDSGNMALCIPFSTIEPVRETLQTSYKGGNFEADMRWRKYLEKKLLETSVLLECTLGTVEIRGRDLQNMKVGDVIALNQRVDEPVHVCIEQTPKFQGYPGGHNNKRAIRIARKISEE